jgi:hypothetical protein
MLLCISLQVNLAAQVCSSSVYAGMKTLTTLGKLPSSASETAVFLKEVNDVFDFLNVRGVRGNHCRPLTADELVKCSYYKEQVSKWYGKGKTRIPPCFKALIQSLNATYMLGMDLVVNGDFKFLLTGRITQDCLENFFSQVRAKGGHRFNPCSREFGQAYRALNTNMLLAEVPSANCKPDNDALLQSLNSLSANSQKSQKRKAPDSEVSEKPQKCPRLQKTTDPNEQCIVESILDFKISTVQSNVVEYIGGYVLRKLELQKKCPDCFSNLITSSLSVVTESQLLTHFKAYKPTDEKAFGSLLAPSECLADFLCRLENLFQKHIQGLLCSEGVFKTLFQLFVKHIPLQLVKLCARHSDGSLTKDMATLYLRCRLHYYFKFESRKLDEKKCKQNRKAKVLKHA